MIKRILTIITIFCLLTVLVEAQNMGLKGKVIVIDPGHAPDDGAKGLAGLTEKELNLKVAQYLKTLLAEKEAIVFLTRDDDKGPFGGQNLAVHTLAARVKMATELNCDLFVSIHHNANAQADRSVNQSEMYFNVFDFGPSQDAAQLIYENLVRELGTSKGYQTPMPAEYYILRKAEGYPAVLGEAAYIINPQAEALLSRDDYQKRQAVAYFKGIEAYFNRGILRLTDISPKNGSIITQTEKLDISTRFLDEKNGPGIDPNSTWATWDNNTIKVKINGDRLIAQVPAPLKNGLHEIKFYAKNKNGNSAMPISSSFLIQQAPQKITLKVFPNLIPPNDNIPVTATAEVTDQNNQPVADGLPIMFLRDGKFAGISYTNKGQAVLQIKGKPYLSSTQIKAQYGNLSAEALLEQKNSEKSWIIGKVLDGQEKPIPNASIKFGTEVVASTSDDGQFILDNLQKGKFTCMVTAAGYIPYPLVFDAEPGSIHSLTVEMIPFASGILQNKTYIVDAAYGGSQSGPVGPTGLSSAQVNLKVALYLKDYLEQAGAKVILPRADLEGMSDIEKVVLDATVPRDEYLIINFGKGKNAEENYSAIFRFPEQKTQLCTLILNEQNNLFGYPKIPYQGAYGKDGMIDDSDYLIVQTYGVRIQPSLLTNPNEENRLKSDSYLRKHAYAIYNALLVSAGLDTTARGDINGLITDINGKAISSAKIEVDDGTVVYSNDLEPAGGYKLCYISSGAHRVTVSAPGYESKTLGTLVKSGESALLDFTLSPTK